MANWGLETSALAQDSVYRFTRLRIGMSEKEVLQIMRHPYRTKEIEIESDIYDVWFYVTRPTALDQSRMVPQNLTPLTFKNGRLIGWGYSYYRYLLERQMTPPKTLQKKPPTEDMRLEDALQKIGEGG